MCFIWTEVAFKEVNDGRKINEDIEDCNLKVVASQSKGFAGLETNGRASLNGSCSKSADSDRKHQIMQEFSKALWNVLKQYKKKLEVTPRGKEDGIIVLLYFGCTCYCISVL